MAMVLGRNCPAVPEHGAVLPPKDGKSKYYCSHQGHDGRPKTHKLGAAAQTRAFFSKAEVESGELEPVIVTPAPDLEKVEATLEAEVLVA